MISLKDEIKRFQNMVYNKQLAEFVTVDQMFVGGGITIESMIHESNFIVEELKKMNAVFLNYCKLNQKVYNKIIQHELNLHVEHGKLNSLTSSFDRKIEDVTKNMQQLYSNMLAQNQKSLSLIENVTSPLKQELDRKVDKVTFQVQMKKFLEQYDQGGFDKEQGLQGIEDRMSNGSSNGGGLTLEGLPIVRKKGKVGYDDFYKLQAQIHNRMKVSDTKLQLTSSEATQGKEMILKYLPTINKNATELSVHTTQIYRLNHQIEEQGNHFNTSLNKLHNDLTQKTNDQYWSTKLEAFYQKQLRPIISIIEQNIKSGQRQFKGYKQVANNRFVLIDDQFSKMHNSQRLSQAAIKNHSRQLEYMNEEIKANHEEFYNQKVNNERNIDNLTSQIHKKFEGLEKSVKGQIQTLKQIIENLVQSIQDSVLRAVNRRIQSQLKVIEGDIKSNRDKIKAIKGDVVSICEDIRNVKDILSRKANFTDIIHQVERKADKEDFKELSARMQETSQQLISKNLNESISLSRADKTERDRARASSLSRANKTLMAPRSATNRANKTDLDVGSKLFICGIDAQYGQSRGIASQKSRRKSIKSSAAVISDFIF